MAAKVANFFEMVFIFKFMRVEAKKFRKMVSEALTRQKKYFVTDRQTDIFFDTIYESVDFFLKLNLLPPYSLHSQGDKHPKCFPVSYIVLSFKLNSYS